MCACGCGKPTKLAKWSNSGRVKGQPIQFLQGHYPRTLETIGEGTHYRIEERGYATPCFIYFRRLDRDGYGRIGGGLRSIYGPERAHIRAYRQQIGPIPEGMVLHHLCENPACVRGDHLRPMNPTEHKRQHSSLTIEIVRIIRASPKSAQKLADEYGVSRRAISLVRQGKTWIED
jgi:hypothetical protein